MRRPALIVAVLAAACTLAAQPAAAQDDALYAALGADGHLGLMRHSTAPGSDDPPGFTLGDCSTQRNLSAAGRAQAAAVGDRLRDHGIDAARVVSSQWCRCRDTAELLDLGPVEELASLNSLVSYPGASARMTRELRDWIAAQDLGEPTLLVTHQVNIGALVGAYPREGEIVVVRPASDGSLEIVGTIGAD